MYAYRIDKKLGKQATHVIYTTQYLDYNYSLPARGGQLNLQPKEIKESVNRSQERLGKQRSAGCS